jgi:hypothetical protein
MSVRAAGAGLDAIRSEKLKISALVRTIWIVGPSRRGGIYRSQSARGCQARRIEYSHNAFMSPFQRAGVSAPQ